jgi:hypothetical protein
MSENCWKCAQAKVGGTPCDLHAAALPAIGNPARAAESAATHGSCFAGSATTHSIRRTLAVRRGLPAPEGTHDSTNRYDRRG